jgi:hypothetical protein
MLKVTKENKTWGELDLLALKDMIKSVYNKQCGTDTWILDMWNRIKAQEIAKNV